jgi:hypothetical protein
MPLEKMRKVLLAKQPIRLEAPISEDGDSQLRLILRTNLKG